MSDIQSMIDKTAAAGGGVVNVPSGKHLCGTLVLKNNITLHLENGAEISGSEDIADYPLPENYFIDAMGEPRGRALILGDGVENIAITGEGVINGNGGAFKADSPDHAKRPFLVRLINCRNVKLSGVTLKDAAAWTCHLQCCTNVEITGIKIDSRVNNNNDGIDVDSCSKVKISGCDIQSGDDGICIKSTQPRPCEDIEAFNCRISTECGALKLGTESYGDMRNIYLHDCEITRAGLGSIKILSSDGANISNVTISGIKSTDTTGPVMIRLGDRCNIYAKGAPKRQAGSIKNIVIEKMSAEVAIPDEPITHHWTKEKVSPLSLSGILVCGIPEAKIESVTLKDIKVKFHGGLDNPAGASVPDEQPAAYPEIHHFGVTPACCAYLRHAGKVTIKNAEFTLSNPDVRRPVVQDDVDCLELENCALPE